MMRALSLMVALLALPGVAMADPITWTAALASVVGGSAAAFVVSNALYIAYLAVTVYGATNARRKARKAAADQRSAYNAGLQDRTVTVLQAAPPWRVIYGRVVTGGDIVAIFTTDNAGTRSDGTAFTKADSLKHLVIVWAAHQCQAINEVYIEGVPVGALDGSGYPTGGEFYSLATARREIVIGIGASSTQPYPVTVLKCVQQNATTDLLADQTYTVTGGGLTINNTSGVAVVVTFTMPVPWPRLRVSHHLGTDTQTVDTYLNSVAPTEWTSSHRLRGLCYSVVTLDLEEPRFQGGPPNITADVQGRLVLDTRTSTTAYSTNNALVLRDFLTAPWGYECLAGDIDTSYCNAAANACDALITLVVGATSTPNQATYTCNGAFTTEASREAVLEDLCESMAGYAVYGAKWQIIAGGWTVPVVNLVDDDLQGQIEVVQSDAGLDETFNGVRGVYVPAGKSVPEEIDNYQNATFVAADGVALWSDLTLPWTDHKARARNLSRIFVERARNALVIRYPAKLRAWSLQVGDRVTVTSSEYGFATKNFRVTDWQFGVRSAVLLTLQEDEAAAYDLADAATADPTPNTNLPNPWAVATLTGVAAASGTTHLVRLADGTIDTRVQVSWNAITDPYITDGSGRVRVLWRRLARDPANVYQTVEVPGNETRAYLSGVSAFDVLSLEVAAINGLGARGNPVHLVHQVIGKSAAPANVASLTSTIVQGGARLSWADNTEVDYESTELRFGASWAAGVRLFRGNASSWTWLSPAQATYTVWAKHFDTTGNESASATSVSVVIDAAALVIIGAGQFTGVVGGGNILTNSSFEADSDADGLADGWVAYAAGTTGTVTRTIEPTGINGGKSQRLTGTGLGTTSGDRIGFYQAGVPVGNLVGSKVVFSAYAVPAGAPNNPKGNLYLEFFNGALASVGSLSSLDFSMSTSQMTRYSLAGQVPSGAVTARAYFWVSSRTGSAGLAQADVDALQLELGDVMTAYAPRADELTQGRVGVIEIAPYAVSDIRQADAAGPVTPSNPGTPDTSNSTLLNSISIAALPAEAIIEVTATAIWSWVVVGNLYGTGLRADWVRSTGSPSPDRRIDTNSKLSPDPGLGSGSALVGESFTQTFTLAANTATTIEHRSCQNNQTGKTMTVSSMSLRAIVRMR